MLGSSLTPSFFVEFLIAFYRVSSGSQGVCTYGVYKKNSNSGLTRKYEVFEKNVSDKSFRVRKEASDGDVDHDLRVEFRGPSKVNLIFKIGTPIFRIKNETNGKFYVSGLYLSRVFDI